MHSKEQIEAVAGALLGQFIPKDPEQNELSFHFTLPPDSYKVSYVKDKKGDWSFVGYQEDIK